MVLAKIYWLVFFNKFIVFLTLFSGGGIGILIPQLENNKIRLQHQYASLPLCQHSSSSSSSVIADTTESTGISPTSPPPNMFYGQGRMDCDSRGCSVLVNGSDPGIERLYLNIFF